MINYAQLVYIPIGACLCQFQLLILVTIYDTNFNARGVASNKYLLFFILICNALMNQFRK